LLRVRHPFVVPADPNGDGWRDAGDARALQEDDRKAGRVTKSILGRGTFLFSSVPAEISSGCPPHSRLQIAVVIRWIVLTIELLIRGGLIYGRFLNSGWKRVEV
jgi:hypothetical protein